MEEGKLLKACTDNRSFYQMIEDKDSSLLFSDLGKLIYGYVVDYYSRDKAATTVDVDVLLSRIEVDHPKHVDRIRNLLESTESVSVNNLYELILAQRKYILKQQLANALLSSDDARVQELMLEYKSLDSEEEESEDTGVYRSVTPDAILKEKQEGSIFLYPKQLHDIVGKVNKGHHIVIYARPECGKTATTFNLVASFLKQGLVVMYVGNEDPYTSMLVRMMSCISERTEEEINADPSGTHEILRERGYDNFIFIDKGAATPYQIEQRVERFNPDVLVVDQIRNLKVGSEGKTQLLESAAMAMRELAKNHNILAVSVTQAGDTAINKRILTMEDVEYSRTGVQGTADVMIGVGADDACLTQGIRYYSVTKNKISSRHEACVVNINPVITKMW